MKNYEMNDFEAEARFEEMLAKIERSAEKIVAAADMETAHELLRAIRLEELLDALVGMVANTIGYHVLAPVFAKADFRDIRVGPTGTKGAAEDRWVESPRWMRDREIDNSPRWARPDVEFSDDERAELGDLLHASGLHAFAEIGLHDLHRESAGGALGWFIGRKVKALKAIPEIVEVEAEKLAEATSLNIATFGTAVWPGITIDINTEEIVEEQEEPAGG